MLAWIYVCGNHFSYHGRVGVPKKETFHEGLREPGEQRIARRNDWVKFTRTHFSGARVRARFFSPKKPCPLCGIVLIQLGRAGPVELATEVKVRAPLEEG